MRPRPSRPFLPIVATLAVSPIGACRCGPQTEAPAPAPVTEEAGERLSIPGAAASILVPEGWTREIDGDLLSLIGPGERVVLTVMVVDAGDLEASLTTLDQELAKVVRGAEFRELREREIGGMRALIGDGKGRLADEPVDLAAMLVRTPNSRIVILFGVALEGADGAAVEAILESLRPAE